MTNIYENIKQLSSEKQQLLKFLLSQEKNGTSSTFIFPQAQEGMLLPLSFSQERIWFFDQLAPGSAAYNIPIARRLVGPLNVQVLERSLSALIERHSILRTFCAVCDMAPVQVIAPPVAIRVPVIDLRAIAHGAQERYVNDLLQEEAARPFTLTRVPLLRAMLLRLRDEEHVLLITTHHFAADGWSVRILLHEFSQFYQSFLQNTPSRLALLPVQYADFAVWQKQSQDTQGQLDYWRRQLAGEITSLVLPTDHQHPPIQNFRGDSYFFMLPQSLAEAIKALARRMNTTVFITLLALFKAFLYRYTQQEDLIVATAVSNRNRAEVEPLIGSFANILLLRTKMSGHTRFQDVLSQEHETALGAYANQDVAFEKLVEVLRPERDRSRTPLFQVLLVLQNAPTEQLHWPGLDVYPIEVRSKAARFDLELSFAEVGQSFRGMLEYNSDVFEASTVERMMMHFQYMAEGAVTHPEQRLYELPLLGGQHLPASAQHVQRQTVKCVHELFEAQVVCTPDSLAVTDGVQNLTYQELNQWSNWLGHRLQTSGVGLGTSVAVFMEPSLEMVVALLAILKAGGAYIPLDPAYPEARLQFMLSALHVPVLITQQSLLHQLPSSREWMVVSDLQRPQHFTGWESNLNSDVTSAFPIYSIYTSGSTGQPKAAQISHYGFTNLLTWFINEFMLTSADSLLLMTSYSFDLTQKDIFAPLIVGGTLHLRDSSLYDAYQIARIVRERKITLLNCTPSAFYPLIDDIDAAIASLRYLFLGGEPISGGRLWPWMQSAGLNTEVVNTYGPTECTDVVAFHRMENNEHIVDRTVPIGKAIPHVELLVLDRYLNPLPVGVAGELWICGASVGFGYLNDAALTAEKFVPHPFSQEAGVRIYRTGDIAKCRPDGTIELLGRSDHQVKIRGYRVELGDIEAALMAYPGVRSAVVSLQEHLQQKQLIAYIVPERAHPATNHLQRKMEKMPTGYSYFRLPNGMEVAHQGIVQTNIIYKEIFQDQVYCGHGIELPDSACVFDVGANIGLFTLFVHQQCRNAHVYAFEPVPPTFAVLRTNAQLYDLHTTLFNVGLSSHSGKETFVFYPHMAGMSGMFSDSSGDKKAFEGGVKHWLNEVEDEQSKSMLTNELDDLLEQLFAEDVSYTCELKKLSDVMRECGVEHIDLLKIDVEKSELDVLKGIHEEDWAKIDQIVIEVHSNRLLDACTALLEQHHYSCEIDQSITSTVNEDRDGYRLSMIYARRQLLKRVSAVNAPSEISARTLRQFLRQKLPEYMLPSTFIELDALPLTVNGKVDRKALPAPDVRRLESKETYCAPRTPIEEELARFWSQLLGVQNIGIYDNFFELGGHSLLLTQIASWIRKTFHIELPLRVLFDATTVAAMTIAIAEQQIEQQNPEELMRLLEELGQ